MDWIKDRIPLEVYSRFKGMSSLDTSMGALTFTNMRSDNAGEYEVKINFQIQAAVYDVVVIKAVPQPQV